MFRSLKRPFYGWWVVAAGIVIQGLPSGLLHQSYGAYVVVLEREFGWSRTTLAGAFSAIRLEEGLLGPLQGWLLDRFGPRAVMRVGTVIFALGFFLFAHIQTVTQFYGVFLMMAVGASLFGFLSITTVIVSWFERRRSFAIGLVLLGTAVGGLMLPFVARGLEAWGWRSMANISGAVTLVLGLLMVQVIRNRPQDMGLLPDGAAPYDASAGTEKAATADVGPAFTLGEAMRMRSFWFISVAHTAGVLVGSVVTVHLVPYATGSLGYSLGQAANLMLLHTAGNLVGRPLGGWMADRTNSRIVTAGGMVGHMVALLVLASGGPLWTVLVFAVLNGVSWGVRAPVVVSMRAEYFGSRSFGSIMGMSQVVVTAGAMIAPTAVAWGYDALDSYAIPFAVIGVLSGLGALFMLFLGPPERSAHAPIEQAQPSAPLAR